MTIHKYFPYDTPRPVQTQILDVVEKWLRNEPGYNKKYLILEAPTGTGKTGIAITSALFQQYLSGLNKEPSLEIDGLEKNKTKTAFIATVNKFLQDAYKSEFGELLADLRGKSNYPCAVNPKFDCSNAPCQKKNPPKEYQDCKLFCHYKRAIKEAQHSEFVSLNFAALLAFLNYTNVFSNRDMLIVDEAHALIDNLTNSYSTSVSQKELTDSLTMAPLIPNFNDVEEYIGFFESLVEKFRKEAAQEAEKLGDDDDRVKELHGKADKIHDFLTHRLLVSDRSNKFLHHAFEFNSIKESVKEHYGLDLDLNSMDDLVQLSKEHPQIIKITKNYVIEKEYEEDKKTRRKTFKIKKVSMKPVILTKIFKDKIGKFANKVLLMSATILDFTTYTQVLGLKSKDCYILQAPSTFPLQNRPIYYHLSVGNLNKDNLQDRLPEIGKRIQALMAHYSDKKGIIHTHTYKIAQFLEGWLKDHRILFPTNADQRVKAFEEHKNSEEPTILMSPSMTEGVDLKDDLCRLQILVKLPYPYLGDEVLKKRKDLYPRYIDMLIAITLVQTVGRAIRNETDYAHTFLMDDNISQWVQRNKDILPKYFVDAFTMV